MLLNHSVLNTVVLNGDDADSGDTGGGGGGFGGVFQRRFITSEALDFILNSPGFSVFGRVRIPDSDGIVREYSTRNGINWIKSIEYSGNTDAPIGIATVKLWREVGDFSLAPLRSGSSYNNPGPSIDAGRRILIDTACVPLGTAADAVLDEDWHTVFDGFIDDVEWADNPITIEARDAGAPLYDTWFPQSDVITLTPPNDTIQDGLQTLLDLGQLDTAVLLYVPVLPTPAVLLDPWRYDIENVQDALQRLAQINGWDLRYRWSDPDQVFRLTYKDPGREKTTPDFTIFSKNYIKVTDIKIDRTNIRNDITIWYSNSDDAGNRTPYRIADPTSVARYGRRSMVLQEASDSPIQKTDAAALMAAFILFDIAEPFADHSIEMFYFWPVELHNLIRFEANLVHADDPLDLSVVAYKHTIDDRGARTVLTTRGKPSGHYWQWLTRRPVSPGDNPDGSPGTPPLFSGVTAVEDFASDHVALSWVWGSGGSPTFEVFTQIALSDGSFTTGFVSQGLQTSPFDFDLSGVVDIEPFREPPDTPQLGVNFSFYIRANITGGSPIASKTYTQSYGDGP